MLLCSKKPRDPKGRRGFEWIKAQAETAGDPLQALLKHGGRGKADALGGFDVHRRSRLGVAALTRFAGGDFEGAKSDELDSGFVFFNAFGDDFKDGRQGIGSDFLGGFRPVGFLDGFDDLSFVHDEE